MQQCDFDMAVFLWQVRNVRTRPESTTNQYAIDILLANGLNSVLL